VPAATAAAVQSAFPKGNLYMELRVEFGTLYDDQLFADLYPPSGRPVEDAPWRCTDWKYTLSLELTDAGFAFTLLHDFPERLLVHEAAQRLLDTFLAACKAQG
jgi:transposase